MNKIWSFVLIISFILLSFSMPENILPSVLAGSSSAISLSIELLAVYAVWLGIINIIENTKLSQYLAICLSPVIRLFWGKNLSKNAKKYLTLSISASLLGIGGASVPLGIKAIENMDDKSGVVTFPIIITIIFASAGLQFLPTTIMSLMTLAGSSNPSVIIAPTFLAGLCTTFTGFGLAHLLEKVSKRKKREKKI